MIIEGGSRRNGKWFATHFMRTDQGQRVTIAEVRGLVGDGPGDWFRQMEAIARGTRCDNFFYHANINPRDDEHLSEEQWEKAVDELENNLGLEGQLRFVVEHEKNGRVHRHVVWSRIDPDTMKAISDSKTYPLHQKTADALEKEFGLERTPRTREDGKRGPKSYEVFRGKETKIDPREVAAEVTALWRQADTGHAFAAALEERGYILAEGRRGLLVVDSAAKEHSLASRVDGARKADIDARMKDVDRKALPSVEEARALARARAAARKKHDKAQDRPPSKDDSALETLAEAAIEVVRDAVAEAKRQPKENPKEPSKPRETAPPSPDKERAATPEAAPEPQPTDFDAHVRDFYAQARGAQAAPADSSTREEVARKVVDGVRAALPVAEQLIVAAAAAEREPAAAGSVLAEVREALHAPEARIPEPALSAFARAAQNRKQALSTAGNEKVLTAAGVAWVARKLRLPYAAPLPPDAKPTAFARAAQERKAALSSNGGEPYTWAGDSFWRRSKAALAQAASWVVGKFQSLVGRRPNRDRDAGPDNRGHER